MAPAVENESRRFGKYVSANNLVKVFNFRSVFKINFTIWHVVLYCNSNFEDKNSVFAFACCPFSSKTPCTCEGKVAILGETFLDPYVTFLLLFEPLFEMILLITFLIFHGFSGNAC